jgi:hypothetical protein
MGNPPRDQSAGHPRAAAALKAAAQRVGARALETAIAADPGLPARYDELGLRQLLRDAELFTERVAMSIGADDPYYAREYATWTSIVYRRRKVPLDDVIGLALGVRAALPSVVDGAARASGERAIDEAIDVLKWNRRLAGDARKKNAFLQFIYKGG